MNKSEAVVSVSFICKMIVKDYVGEKVNVTAVHVLLFRECCRKS